MAPGGGGGVGSSEQINGSKERKDFQKITNNVVMTRNLVDLGEGKQYKYNVQYTSRVARKII